MVEPMEHKSLVRVKRDAPEMPGRAEVVRSPRRAEFQPIRATRAFEEIADQIRRELSSRRLRAGDRLPISRLATSPTTASPTAAMTAGHINADMAAGLASSAPRDNVGTARLAPLPPLPSGPWHGAQ